MNFSSRLLTSVKPYNKFVLPTGKYSPEKFLSVLFLTFLTKDCRDRGDQIFLLNVTNSFSILESYPKNELV